MTQSRPKGVVLAGFAALLSGCAEDPGLATVSPEPCILLCALARYIAGDDDQTKPALPLIALVTPTHETKKHPAVRTHVAHMKPPSGLGDPAPIDATPAAGPIGSTVVSQAASQALPPDTAVQPVSKPSVYTSLPGSAPIDEITWRFVPRDGAQP